MLYYISIKYKRIITSILALEIYSIIAGFDIIFCLAFIFKIIINALEIPDISIVIYIDSFSLYECLIKLGITDEKCLIIDIISLRESYKNKEISEIR